METPVTFSRRNPEPKRRRPSTVTIPQAASPHVKLVFAEMQRQRMRYDDVEDGSGVLRTTLKAWRTHNYPGLTSIEAVLGFLGYTFIPVPQERVLPPEVIAELQPIAERLGLTMGASIEALIALAAGIHANVERRAAA